VLSGCLVLPALAVSALFFAAAPAFAAAPETPVVLAPTSVFASTATFSGTLSPEGGVPAEGAYVFLYQQSKAKTGCAGGGVTPGGIPLGSAPEPVNPEPVSGLAPNTEYEVCLQVTNLSTETATSLPIAFKTGAAAPPEAPVAEPPSERKSESATLLGTVNPLAEGEPGTYRFLYRESESEPGKCTGTGEVLTPEEPAPGSSPQPVALAITELKPGRPYTFCLQATNALGESTLSPPRTFNAALPPETPSGEAVEPASVTSSTASVSGLINPAAEGEKGTYRFLYSPSTISCAESGSSAPETPVEYGTGKAEPAQAKLEGLLPGTVYTFCLQATNEAGEPAEGPPVQFKTLPAAPTVSAPTTGPVGSGTAEVSAQVDPGGEPTSYQVQYVTDAAFAAHGFAEPSLAPSSAGEIPAVNHPETVRVTLAGLSPSTGYHFRFIAGNETGKEALGAEGTFTTAAAEGALPDNRAYELVSTGASGEPFLPQYPPSWQSSVLRGKNGTFTFQAAAGGDGVTYESEPGLSGGIGDESGSDQTVALRTASGWQAQDITPEGNATSEPLFQAFSPELSTAILEEPREGARLGAGVTAGCDALDVTAGPAGHRTFAPLYTAAEPGGPCGNPLVAGESTDGKHVIFQTEGALTHGAVAATEIPREHAESGNGHQWGEETGEGCAYGCNLYESGEGGLTLVNQIEEGGVLHQVANATLGGYRRERDGIPDFSHAVSADGSRVFWTDTAPDGEGNPLEEVYVLEDGTREVKVSGPDSQYWTATPDGRYAYYIEDEGFYESQPNHQTPYGRLYRFDTETNTTVALTPAGGEVIAMIGANTTGADGEYVYFVARAVFGTGAAEEPNYYVIHDGETKLVATASSGDVFIGAADRGIVNDVAPWTGALGLRQMQVSPDGTHLVFQTKASLTGFNNESGAEVFVYSAADGRVACVSCDAAGTPPEVNSAGDGEARSGKLAVSAENETYTHRWMSADGSRVFFNTSQSLVPEDRNGVEDVYEWEREGTGSCPVKTPASPVGGCQFLLSGGQSPAPSFFVDADETGDDAFFVHVGNLGAVQANPGHLEVYDARVDGGFPPSSTGCSGAACQGALPPGSPAPSSAPASAVFTGAGNYPPGPPPLKPRVLTRAQLLARALAVCRRAHPRGHARAACERRGRARYGRVRHPAKRSGVRRSVVVKGSATGSNLRARVGGR
jgi:hypothetical protein